MNTPTEVTLRQCVTLEKGKPPVAQPYYGADADRYLTPEYLRKGGDCALAKAVPGAARAKDGQTILLWDGSNAGEVLRGRTGILASTMSRASHAERFDDAYFFYALKQWEPYLKGQTSGSGIPHIDKELFGDLTIIEFDLPEQCKIAEVLLLIDRAIEQTEALLAKQRHIKTGLTQDLLTRGIDEHGNLRSELTHEFKDSPLGRIPVEWEVETLGAVLKRSRGYLQTGPFGSQLHAHEYVPEGTAVIMPQDILDGRISTRAIARIPERRANELRRHRLLPNDIVFARRGDLSRDPSCPRAGP